MNSANPVSAQERLQIEPVKMNFPFKKYSYFHRLIAHRHYSSAAFERIAGFRPDVVLAGNPPSDAAYYLQTKCTRAGFRFVHWIQDFYPLAIEQLLNRRFPGLGLAAWPFHLLERRVFRASHAVVYISPDFQSYAESVGYRARRNYVIENWAAIEELPMRPKENPWSVRHGIARKFVFLYSGTMGLKHNPEVIVELAGGFRGQPGIQIVVVSEGIGRKYLEHRKAEKGLDNLLLLDFQPYDELPDVMGSADVLLANVEAESSKFSVPSKVLSYLCAGRPILLSVPKENLIARVLEKSGAGFVTEPGDAKTLLTCARKLVEDAALRKSLGDNARRYAETTFDIEAIAHRFEQVMWGSASACSEL